MHCSPLTVVLLEKSGVNQYLQSVIPLLNETGKKVTIVIFHWASHQNFEEYQVAAGENFVVENDAIKPGRTCFLQA